MIDSTSTHRSLAHFILATSSLLLAACGDPGAQEQVSQLEQEHVGHNNPDINGIYKAGYSVEFPDVNNQWWAKHNYFHPVTGMPSGWVSSRISNPKVCHSQGGVYGATTCKTATRMVLPPVYVGALRGQTYWSGFSAAQITTLLERHSVFDNHYSHADTSGYDANNALIVRFDVAQSLRNRATYTVRATLDLAIPNQAACTNQNSNAIPNVTMEAYALMSTSQSTMTGWYQIGLGAWFMFPGIWNASTSTCTVSAALTLTRPSGSYPWLFKATANGGLGHLPAPVAIRLE